MSNVNEKKGKRDLVIAARRKKCAQMTGVTVRHVRRILNGECENDLVVSVYMELVEGEKALETQIKQTVNQ